MTLMICADVFLRNVRIVPGLAGLEWANEISEAMLFLVTLLTAPWLLRRGQHIRVDIVMRAVRRASAGCSSGRSTCWVSPAARVIFWYSGRRRLLPASRPVALHQDAGDARMVAAQHPATRLCALTVEMLFRMRRLWLAERAARDDAVSTG